MKVERQRILLAPSAYYPSLGGVEEICRNLAVNLANDGFEVAVATNRYPSNLPEHEELYGVDVHRFDFYYPGRSASQLLQSGRCVAGFSKFRQFISDWRPEIVHVICPSVSALYLWAARSMIEYKTLVTFQGELFMDPHQIYLRSWLMREGLKRLLSVTDGVTACSKYVLDDVRTKYALAQSMQKVIFNGVDLEEQAPPNNEPVHDRPFILGLGRLVKNKGFDVLIEAF